MDDHAAETPVGSPVAVPIPVAPVVEWVMFVIAELIHTDVEEEAVPAVFVAITVTAAETSDVVVYPDELFVRIQ